jgi:acyl carrier protein
MNETITDQVRAIASDLFEVPIERVSGTSSPDTIDTWDSLQHLNLILELEMQFGVKFTPKEISAMTSIGSVVAALDIKLRPVRGAGFGNGEL